MIFKSLIFIYVLVGFCSKTAIGAAPLGTPNRDDIEYPDEEPHSKEEIELGKQFFFDPRLSVNKRQSCATCHNPDLGFGDGLETAIGTQGSKVPRNSPHLYNLAWNVVFTWDGRAATLEEQALGPIESKIEMGMSLSGLVERLNQVAAYQKSVKAIYGDNEIKSEHVARAIAAFERTIISDNSPFDQYRAGNEEAMSPSAIRGMKLFEGKARCTECHDGPNFTDNSFHNIGIKTNDEGRFEIVKDASLKSAFKTPGLRNVALTAPYMHNGSLGTLEDVIKFYNEGGHVSKNRSKVIQSLNLSDTEIMDLIAFMGALTDPVIITRPVIPK